MNLSDHYLLRDYFRCRPCWICGSGGCCEHRQIDVARAELDWLNENRPLVSRIVPRIEPGREIRRASEDVTPETERPANGYGWKKGVYPVKRAAND